MTNFSWSIVALNCTAEKDGLPKVIHTIHWRYNVTKVVGDKTYFVDTYGASGVGQPNPENFIPYEDITEAEIISWLEATLPIESMQSGLEAKLEEQINPTELTPELPWAKKELPSVTATEVPVFEEPITTENDEAV